MATIRADQHKWLLRKFHTIAGAAGMTGEEKLALITSYGVESSKDMTAAQLADACELMEQRINPSAAKANRLRKRVLAAITDWLKAIGKEADIEYAKGIACRAAGVERFNRIAPARLTNLYNLFKAKARDARAVDSVCGEIAYEQRFGALPETQN